jgi:PAS domain S-box-containing protein
MIENNELRRQAEAIFARIPENPEVLTPEENQRLLHELGVHQIELEMQNEELRRVQQELETSQARYFELYDLAPAAYLTVSEPGMIVEVNLSACALFGVARRDLVSRPLTRFVFHEDAAIYHMHRQQLFASGEVQECTLRMLNAGGALMWVYCIATIAQDIESGRVCRAVLADITQSKQAEARIVSQLEELKRWEGVMLDREDRVQELKREVNELCRSQGGLPRYPSQGQEARGQRTEDRGQRF